MYIFGQFSVDKNNNLDTIMCNAHNCTMLIQITRSTPQPKQGEHKSVVYWNRKRDLSVLCIPCYQLILLARFKAFY